MNASLGQPSEAPARGISRSSAAASWGAVARELARRYPARSLCVLEREHTLGAHQTSRSSGVIQAGIYYEPGSLKARLCPRARGSGIPTERCGKLIVAVEPGELGRLRELERRARANGVADVRLMRRPRSRRSSRTRAVSPRCIHHTPGVSISARSRVPSRATWSRRAGRASQAAR